MQATVTYSSDQLAEWPEYVPEIKIGDITQFLGKSSLHDNSQSPVGTNTMNHAYVGLLGSSM
jgi:hypothetical protein